MVLLETDDFVISGSCYIPISIRFIDKNQAVGIVLLYPTKKQIYVTPI